MLMRTDPFRELDRPAQHLLGPGTRSKPSAHGRLPRGRRVRGGLRHPLRHPGRDRHRRRAEHAHRQGRAPAGGQGRRRADGTVRAAAGLFSRQIVLADALDNDHIKADYDAGVLTLCIPIAERAEPRKISIGIGSGRKEISG